MNIEMVNRLVDRGIAINLAAGHVGELWGRAVQAASQVTGCPFAMMAGRAVEAGSRAWSDAVVMVGNRDRFRLTE